MYGAGDPFPSNWQQEERTGYWLGRLGDEAAAQGLVLALPEGEAPDAGWPLLIVLDGALHFDAVAAAAAALARRPGKTGVHGTAVLGIASGAGWTHDPGRRRDTLVPGMPGCDELLRRIAALVPSLASVARFDQARTWMIGHSLGGLFTLHAVSRPTTFLASAVAFSPSLWAAPYRTALPAAPLLIVSGEQEARINGDLPDTIARMSADGGDVYWRMLAAEDHGSVPFAGLPLALRFLHGHGDTRERLLRV